MSDEAEQPVGAAEDQTAVMDAGRMRRPSSLRAAAASGESGAAVSGEAASRETVSREAGSSEVRRPKLTPPSFASKLTVPPLPGKLTPPSFLRRDSKPEAQETGPSPSQKLVTLVSERPEVGLGIAFAAGLVIATILKRLAR